MCERESESQSEIESESARCSRSRECTPSWLQVQAEEVEGGSGDYLPVCERANGREGGTRGMENARMPPSQARVLGGWLATWEGVRHDSARW